MTTTLTRDQRARALREAIRRAQSVGPFSIPVTVGLTAGFVASFVVDALLFETVGTPVRQLLDAVAFAAVAAPVWLGVQRQSVRHAIEVLTWLNGWETERWERELGRRLPALPRATPALLDDLPDTLGLRPLRIELLAVRAETSEAWSRVESLPADTPWQRFERAALTEWVLWWTDGPEHIGSMAQAAAEVDDPERALVAQTMVAAARARRAAVIRGDAVTPLAQMRGALGDRPRRYAFSYRTGVAVSVGLIAVVAVGAVTITSAIIR